MSEMKWRPVGVKEALDHAVGRTISQADWNSDESVTCFTDGTAVRMEIEHFGGSSWTGSWTEESFAIGTPDGKTF